MTAAAIDAATGIGSVAYAVISWGLAIAGTGWFRLYWKEKFTPARSRSDTAAKRRGGGPSSHGRAAGDQDPAATVRFMAIVLGFAVGSYSAIGAGSDLSGSLGNVSTQRANTMKIRIDVQGMVITASLEDTDTARDFVALLPLTLTLRDYASTEKISDLPRKLSIKGAPPGIRPVVGDIAYYAPWGNIAIFYKDFGYSSGLVKLGTLDSGPEALSALREPMKVRVELIK